MASKLHHLMLATVENTADPMAWSGSAIEISEALSNAVERLTIVDNLPVKKHPVHAAVRLALGRFPNNEPRYPLWMSTPALHDFAQRTAKAIEQHRPEALLCISSQCLVYLHEYYKGPAIPVFSYSDTPWMLFLELYKDFWPYPVGTARYAARERAAIRRCTGAIYATEWARQDAIRRFELPPERVHVQSMGASWIPTESESEIEATILARPRNRVDILYIGKEWKRKSGPMVIEIARQLRASGRVGDVKLHIVGANPELQPGDEAFIQVYGLLRRSDPTESALLRKLLCESHFLLVPTSAECFGLVFAEAQAFGVPPISRAVGAVPSVILDGETGLVLPIEAGAEAYVQRILDLLANGRDEYVRMALAGRRNFRQHLNWPAFGQGIVKTIGESLPLPASAHDHDGHVHDGDPDVLHALAPLPVPSHSRAPSRSHSFRTGS
ncbi:glycosyltransferase [Acidipila sp. EB88]|nr:glycosyltransferase [Acidipila sp. EB88]